MTTRRYRDVSEMSPSYQRVNASLEERIAAACERAHPHGKMPLLRGVMRFRTIEEAQTARRVATIERMRRLRAGR